MTLSSLTVSTRLSRRGLVRMCVALCAVVAGLALGCHARFPTEQVPRMQMVVFPFEQPAAMSDATKVVRGWWFGARTIRQNPRAGALLANLVASRLAEFDFVNLYSTIDLRYYMADKRDRLVEAYPALADDEIETLLAEVPVVEFGRELGVDKVVTGRIVRQYMGQHNLTSWWWSRLEAECRVVDVFSGRTEWRRTYTLKDSFASQLTLQHELAERLAEDLQTEYFEPMTR